MPNKDRLVLLTPEELSEAVSVPLQTLAYWRMENKGPPYYKVNHLVRYDMHDVKDWLEENKNA